jgi:hypothetical protein
LSHLSVSLLIPVVSIPTATQQQPSALVAVVRLSASCQRLERAFPLQWGEIVPVDAKDGFQSDWRHRQSGRLALRLLGRGDIPGMHSETAESPLELGTRVVVLDLRVFVPEVVSVLGTLARASFGEHLEQIPFVARLIGLPGEDSGFQYSAQLTLRKNVALAIAFSDIDFVRRMDAATRESLAKDICRIPIVR